MRVGELTGSLASGIKDHELESIIDTIHYVHRIENRMLLYMRLICVLLPGDFLWQFHGTDRECNPQYM